MPELRESVTIRMPLLVGDAVPVEVIDSELAHEHKLRVHAVSVLAKAYNERDAALQLAAEHKQAAMSWLQELDDVTAALKEAREDRWSDIVFVLITGATAGWAIHSLIDRLTGG